MKLIKTSLTLFAALVIGANTFADRDFAEIYKECGLGAMIFPDDPIIAVITNVTWDLGTTAVSSELTSPDTCKGNSATMAAFIFDAHPQIEQDLSTGEGEYLSAMTTLMGCESEAAAAALRAQFVNAIDEGYFAGSEVDKSEALYNAAMTTSALHCTI